MSSFYSHHRLIVTLALVILTIAVLGFLYIRHEDFMGVGSPAIPTSGEQAVAPKINTSVYVYGPELNKVKVSLVSSDEKEEILKDSFCGGIAGSKQYSGYYKLVLDPNTAASDNPGGHADMNWGSSEVDLGELSFVEGTPWDKNITVDALDPNGYKNFILLEQYASCNGVTLSVFGYDFETGKLMRYKFAGPGALAQVSLFVSDMKKSKEGNLLTSAYNNATGVTQDLTWVFDSSAKVFRSVPVVPVSNPVACTEEAKQCPDGSYVGRTGVNCEFTACPSVATTGILSGTVTIGPNCPVEQIGVPCPAPLSAYTSREVIVYNTSGKIEITRKHFNPDGTYSFSLPVGKYVIDVPHIAIGGSPDLPKTVAIKSGETTTLNFSIDTGIR